MYRIKDKYIGMVTKFGFTKLDITASYSLETWLKAGFKEYILEEI